MTERERECVSRWQIGKLMRKVKNKYSGPVHNHHSVTHISKVESKEGTKEGRRGQKKELIKQRKTCPSNYETCHNEGPLKTS